MAPMCGFSAQVAQVLLNMGIDFETRDILQDIYNHKIIETNLKKIIVYKEAEITNSLYSSATKLGIKSSLRW